jgi:hypothetical protein
MEQLSGCWMAQMAWPSPLRQHLDRQYSKTLQDSFYAITGPMPRRLRHPVNSIAYVSYTNQCLASCRFPMLISHKSLDRLHGADKVVSIACVIYALHHELSINCNTPTLFTSSFAQFTVAVQKCCPRARRLDQQARSTVPTQPRPRPFIPRQDVLSAGHGPALSAA